MSDNTYEVELTERCLCGAEFTVCDQNPTRAKDALTQWRERHDQRGCADLPSRARPNQPTGFNT